MVSLPRLLIAQLACFTTCKLRIPRAHDVIEPTQELLRWRFDQYYGSETDWCFYHLIILCCSRRVCKSSLIMIMDKRWHGSIRHTAMQSIDGLRARKVLPLCKVQRC